MPHPFPFFGAGAAQYYERAAIEVRFTRRPSPVAQKKIMALAPAPIRPDSKSFVGKMLAAHSTQYVNEAIQRFYGEPKDVDKKEQKELGKQFYVTAKASRAFDAAVEKWLLDVHEVCPIELVYRAEDLEAGGTELSAWHEASLAAIPALLKTWNADKTIARLSADELRLFAYCAQAIVAYGEVEPKAIPATLRTLFPYEFLRAYFATGDQRSADQLLALLPDSRPALAAVSYGTYEARKAQSLADQAGFLYFIRGLVDAKSIDSSQHASLIFDIFYAAVREGDDRFATTFSKLIADCDNKVTALERFAGGCNGICAGYGKNEPDPKLAAKLAGILLKVPLTKTEKAEAEFLTRLREIEKRKRA
ncbi:hypothetical protein [Nannocystis radixulma]|uniref:Uncharacterized protein n=1 Tax=Nannocystis radixulma TaxID=2995305 RepID=A0ABT5BPB8_9BACT|nr:hypothetical protein [Nannocystis radixulma]MDC0676010.1 hypothetical protein [Nannocystis radixulma]